MGRKNWKIILILCVFVGHAFCGCSDESSNSKGEEGSDKDTTTQLELTKTIPVGGNCWVVSDTEKNGVMMTESGVTNWMAVEDEVKAYFKVEQIGELHLGLKAKSAEGRSCMCLSIEEQTKTIDVIDSYFTSLPVGVFQITKKGYVVVTMKGLAKTGNYFADISDVLIGGPVAEGNVWYVKDDFYWGRRGPSVHLSYEIPGNSDNVKWYYNEVTIPEGQDVIGSYYMANGFAYGYFGIQVNSETERRVLFSVWSPYSTDNPDEIPVEDRIQLLEKGEGVVTGEFGNEGSGGQSFLRFMWNTGITYRFLLKGEPSEDNHSDFTAYFFDPEEGNWRLIASFRRPKTSSYLTRFYSFLENFNPDYGRFTRHGYFGNQWAVDEEGDWIELTSAKFTADATARKEARMDYAGGVENGRFFLKNCGFFNETTPLDTMFNREATGNQPDIDFKTLP